MLRHLVPMIALVAIASAAAAQEAGYGEVRVALSRVPPSFVKTAEKEAPGVQLSIIYRDNEKGYRFVGNTADGRTYSVRVDREGAVEWRHVYADILPAGLPKPVAATLRDVVATNKDLPGFRPSRTSRVERFNARKNETATYYEVFGDTPARLHPRVEIDASGVLLKVDTGFIPSLEDLARYEPLAAKDIPPVILQGIRSAAPDLKLAKVFRVTNRGIQGVRYEAFGRVDRARGSQVATDADGQPLVLSVSVPRRQVPKAALEAIERESGSDKRLVGFRPAEIRLRHVISTGRDQYEFFGDNHDREPLSVWVDGAGKVFTMRDIEEPIREQAGFVLPRSQPEGGVAEGFSVLSARFGVDHHWVDVTEAVRAAVAEGRKEFRPDALPDPATGRHKAVVMLFAQDGKVGLSETRDDAALPLEVRGDNVSLASVPARGFAVLAAHFGFDEKWADVTAAVRVRVADGRLDFLPAESQLPDPAPGEPKAIAVAYASGGKAGLYVQSQWRSPNLPPDAAPVNSGSLLARSIEFPQKPSLVAFAPDGRNLVVGVEDGSIRVLDAASGREVRRLDGDRPGWHPVAFSGDGAAIASGGVDGVVRIWDVKMEREKAVLRGHTDKVQRVAFSPTRRHLASTSWDKTVRLWDVATGRGAQVRGTRRLRGRREIHAGRAPARHRGLGSDGEDLGRRRWAQGAKLETTGDALGDVSLSKTGRDVFFGAKDGMLRWWQPASNREPASVKTYTECEWACAVLPDGHRVLVSDKVAAALWDCRTTHPVLRLEGHTGRVTGLAVAPDGRRAATCSEDKSVRFWNLPELGR